MFDTDYVEIAGSNPLQHRTKILDWADRALRRSRKPSWPRTRAWRFAAMIDRNGYLPFFVP